MSPRRLTKGEWNKLRLLGTLLFVLGNLFALNALIHRGAALEAQLRELHARLGYSQAWLDDRDLWTKRGEWLAQKQPPLKDPGQGNVLLLESLQKLAAANNLTVLEPTLKDPRQDPHFQEVSVHLSLSGSLESLCRWLVAVQQPEQFQAITNFSLKSESDGNKVRCELDVARWYAPQ